MWHIPGEPDVGGAVLGCFGQSAPHGTTGKVACLGCWWAQAVNLPGYTVEPISEAVVPVGAVASAAGEASVAATALRTSRFSPIVRVASIRTIRNSTNDSACVSGSTSWVGSGEALSCIETITREELGRCRSIDTDVVCVSIEAVDRAGWVVIEGDGQV